QCGRRHRGGDPPRGRGWFGQAPSGEPDNYAQGRGAPTRRVRNTRAGRKATEETMISAALICDSAFWRLRAFNPGGVVDTVIGPKGIENEALAGKVRAVVSGQEELGISIVLCPPSDHFVAAGVSLGGLPRRDRHTALGYRFEEFVPLAAEEIDARFFESG